ncbi:MAG: hypothetical protein AVDCRST_MAG62-1651, partial [uncultured Sphingomonas sp.]
ADPPGSRSARAANVRPRRHQPRRVPDPG